MVLADVLNNVITYITGGAFLVVIIEESVRAALRKKREKREAEEKKHEENARKIEEQETEAKIKTATDKSLEPVIRALALLTDDVRNNTSNQKDILIQIQAVDKKADKLEDRQSKLIIQVNAVTEDVEKVKESQLATLRNTLNDLFWACTERGYK
ncbi:MAG: hypothetical protein HUJ56_02080, partial [Erysipelotrichaceae bacterium]|nr:hypothetical protein [Erysipelotrichaceae bacterium]